MIITHQRRKDLTKEKEFLYSLKNWNCTMGALFLDHIIPYCICEDDSLGNLRLLTHKQDKIKRSMDWNIINQLKEEGFIETLTHYSLELLCSPREVKERYLELREKYLKKHPEHTPIILYCIEI